MKIVMLEKTSLGDDVNISALEQLGELVVYDTSTEEETRERVAEADVILVNKVPMNAYTLEKATHAKLLCVTATGTNIVDMWPGIPQTLWHSTPLRCCFMCWKS